MKIQVINATVNKLVEELDSTDISDGWRPMIDEVVFIKSDAWVVKGVAHMWETSTIKLLCTHATVPEQ